MSITSIRLAQLGVAPFNDDPAYKELMALDLPDEVIGMAALLLGHLVVAVTPTDIHYEEGKGVGFAHVVQSWKSSAKAKASPSLVLLISKLSRTLRFQRLQILWFPRRHLWPLQLAR